jgi:hypothetical protein
VWVGDLIIQAVAQDAVYVKCFDVLKEESVAFDITGAGAALVTTGAVHADASAFLLHS